MNFIWSRKSFQSLRSWHTRSRAELSDRTLFQKCNKNHRVSFRSDSLWCGDEKQETRQWRKLNWEETKTHQYSLMWSYHVGVVFLILWVWPCSFSRRGLLLTLKAVSQQLRHWRLLIIKNFVNTAFISEKYTHTRWWIIRRLLNLSSHKDSSFTAAGFRFRAAERKDEVQLRLECLCDQIFILISNTAGLLSEPNPHHSDPETKRLESREFASPCWWMWVLCIWASTSPWKRDQ